MSDQGSQLTSSDSSINSNSHSREQVQVQDARSKTTWEFIPAGFQWRNRIVKSRVEALKVALECVLSRMLHGEELTLSYSNLCTLLAVVENAVNKRSVALRTLTDNFEPLTANQMLLGGTPGAAVEHCDDLEERNFGASKHQRDLFDIWWKRWKQQGFTSLLPYSHLKKDRRHANIEVGDVCLLNYDNMVFGTCRLCQVLRNEISTCGQRRTVRVGYEEGHSLAGRKNEGTPQKEIVVSVQRLVLLVPTDKMELPRTFTTYDFGVLGACRPRLP